MSKPAAFDLVPLLLPEPGGRLLSFGWHPGLDELDWSAWDEVTVLRPPGFHDARSSARLDCKSLDLADAILVVDEDLFRRKWGYSDPIESPVATVVRGAPSRYRRLNGDSLVRYALPVVGRPLVWSDGPGMPSRSFAASPRGRFDLALLATQRYLYPLRALGIGWVVSADYSRSVIAQLLSQAGIESGHWQHTRTKQLIVMNKTVVIKIPLYRVASGFFRDQTNRVNQIRHTLHDKQVQSLLPREQRELQIGPYVAGVELRLPGRSAFHSLGKPSELQRIFHSAAKFLTNWYPHPCSRISVSEAFFEEHWVHPLMPLARVLDVEGENAFWSELLDLMRSRVVGQTIPCVPVHGDFWLNNLLVDEHNHELTGIVDWDHAILNGLPLLDLFHLLTWRTKRFVPDFSVRAVQGFFHAKERAVRDLLYDHCNRIGLDPGWIPHLFCRYWLEQVAQRVEQFFPGNKLRPGLKAIREALARLSSPYSS